MSAYEDDSDKLAEHTPEDCDDTFCQICETRRRLERMKEWEKLCESIIFPNGRRQKGA
jgi:hypothetical protein